jgi:DNA-binding transcriptional MerR regulator
MKYQAKYSIGDMSKICNISKKALRYYDRIGLIATQRQDYNNYRYYTHDSLLAIPVIKYYKQMGFKLEEMRNFIDAGSPNVYSTIKQSFRQKILELKKQQEEIEIKHTSVRDWYELVLEAEMVLENNINEVSVKYMEPEEILFQCQEYEQNIKASIINIDWTNYVESIKNAITGPVMLYFSSFKDRMENKNQKITVLQKTLQPCPEGSTKAMGGCIVAACYHIGPHEHLGETYKKISAWCRKHGYRLADGSLERYVTDYWTTSNSALFVTEVLVEASRKSVEAGEVCPFE